ncbi:efflux RND transporter permease subunit [Thiotrichales bacterium 19S9-12]|nr:efflux RND transporter permease subunit [Thiotrichales bacterium 19S9-11]MCF6811821.1 efflux RND transporter permease subunit [Thiotrichales bacterium 19S9-12]
MKFTDIFIRRPILATVVSLLLVVAGIGSAFKLQIREYPEMTNTIITVTTSYPGASSQVIQGFVTTPLEQSIGSADGIDYMTSSSDTGLSTITVYVRLNYDPTTALTDITGKVNAVLNQLPEQAESPTIVKTTGDTFPSLILSFTSNILNNEEISAYLNNVFVPKVTALGGISQIVVWGDKPYAMRIWLNYKKMAQYNITTTEITDALTKNSVISAAGDLKTNFQNITINAMTDAHSVEEFKKIIVANNNGNPIRLGDIAEVKLGSQYYNAQVSYNGLQGVFTGVQVAPTANELAVINNVIANLPDLKAQLPDGLKLDIVYNTTEYISSSIEEVVKTLIEAIIIVTVVLFAFFGSPRTLAIPIVTIPLSMIGAAFLMDMMGFSINLLTLLSMVLAIGLLVDDAIVVLENIYRHVEEGKTPFEASIIGAREIAMPVIVMTLTLAAVYAPIGMLGGLTGNLFTEFAYTLAGAVIISGIVALTLSPMMCSKMIKPSVLHSPMVKFVDRAFDKLKNLYHKLLITVLDYKILMIILAAVVLASIYFLMNGTKSELAPTEDQSYIGVMGQAPTSANINYLSSFNKPLEEIFKDFPDKRAFFIVDGVPSSSQIMGGVMLKPWDERSTTQMELKPILQNEVKSIAGLNTFVFEQAPLPGSDFGAPIQFVLTSTLGYEELNTLSQDLIQKAKNSKLFLYIDSDLRFDKPQLNITINRDKASQLGINMQDIASMLARFYSGYYTNYFSMLGYSYQIIPQLPDSLRQTQEQLENLYIKTSSGELVPLSSIVSFKVSAEPSSLNRFQQLNSVTLQGVMMPGVTQGQALGFLTQSAKETLPKSVSYDYASQSRQYMQEGSTMVVAFLFAMIVIFLMLAAKFESFRDPIIILITVPLSICGAMIPLYIGSHLGVGFATINIYTQVGLVTLIGLISKHGILMVEFANQLQEEGATKRQAIEQSAAIRLRPILMTTAAMVVGVLPLLFASGAGAESRHAISIVIVFGMLIGTLFTLFVVPCFYLYLAKDRKAFMKLQHKEEQIINRINQELKDSKSH